jgi:S-adenosylmethionine:tRNA ribosyltransferase-isomerase
MTTEDYDYICPEHLIAQHPLSDRASCKLMQLDEKGQHIHHIFKDIPKLLPKNALMVFNNTKVQHARIPIKRKSGGVGEMLIQQADPNGGFIAMGRPSKRLKEGELVHCLKNKSIQIKLLKQLEDGCWHLDFLPSLNYPEDLQLVGEIPLPPYIQRPEGPSEEDDQLYQTVFAKQLGSAAAPTASLHFTNELLQQIEQLGIETTHITLHVGSGTFLPVRTENIEDHIMHREIFEIETSSALKISRAKKEHRPIIAVGTTVVRALESAAEKILKGEPVKSDTQLFIRPPYELQVVDELVTNFHLPKSTLLMLVSAFCGRDRLMNAYREAIQNNYRLFSYGDAMYLKKSYS